MPPDKNESSTPQDYAPPRSDIHTPELTFGRVLVRVVVIAIAVVLALFGALLIGIFSGLIPFEC